ncbi:MAG: ChaN family lipoprotein [Chloracidobacterium sp.]|nr:ChaN family lipoprotein [Chloracidobacterium sp.]
MKLSFSASSTMTPVGHAIQAEIFRRIVAKYSPERKVALSLEMFERDVQIIVDEYWRGLISEAQFMASSRPWGNYKTDYRPLFELAKDKKLDIVAANAPRRYVNMVSRNGRDSINSLTKKQRNGSHHYPTANRRRHMERSLRP